MSPRPRRGRTGLAAPVVALAAAALTLAGCTAPVSQVRQPGSRPSTSSGSTSASPTGSSPTASPTATTAGLDVVAENAQPGTPGWRRRPTPPGPGTPEGFLDHSSVVAGTDVVLRASAPGPTLSISVYRVGWYGGAGGRRLTVLPDVPVRPQPAARTVEPTRTIVAPWAPTTTISTTDWPEGLYYLRLETPSGALSYVPLVVRSTDTAGRVVLMSSVLTWQAYNTWGGLNLYGDESSSFSKRSFAVSFDRPYDDGGAGKSVQFDLPLVQAAERSGVPLAYLTSIDVSTIPGILTGARGLVSDGHDEYWTVPQRRAVEAARAAGTNLAFLGANTVYWRVRLGDSRLGPDRVVLGYKGSPQDPQHASSGATTRFRDAPDPMPEERLTGQRYDCYPATGAFTIRDPSFFLFSGTGVSKGSSFANLVGTEVDRPYPSSATPRPLQVPALSRPTCRGRTTWSAMVYHALPGGPGTVSVGTMNWVRPLAGPAASYGLGLRTSQFVQRVTTNLLRAMAVGPMGAAHPSVDDLTALGLPSTNTNGGP